jgi:RimJ/RimL family protein N-acetyltransferase
MMLTAQAVAAETAASEVSGRFELSPLRDGDRAALVSHLQDPAIAHASLRIPFPYTEIDAQRWVGLARARERQFGRTMVWAIRDAERLVGCIGFESESPGSHKAELGYWLARPYWGQGIMTGVVRQVTQIGLERYGWRRVAATVFDFNRASCRVLEKCGFHREAVLRQYFCRGETLYDAQLFVRLR